MKNNIVEKYISYFIAAVIGLSAGYLVSGLVFLKLPADVYVHKKIQASSNKQFNYKNAVQVVLRNDIFGIETGVKSSEVRIKKAAVVSNINGYSLIGFISGKDPMALFKKPGKPVVIVTKKNGIDGVWLLDAINENGVYLKNKKTKEVKKFEFPRMTKKLSILGRALSVTYSRTSISPKVEKIVVSKRILNKIGNINTLLRQINIVPVFRNGKAFGYKINYISKNSILRKIGLRRGDIIVSINGEPTTDPNKVMNLYSQIRNMTTVNMDIIRNGVKKTIFVDIK